MGNIEKVSKRRKSTNDIKKAILTSVKVAGLLSVALVVPNAVQCLKSFGFITGKRQDEVMARSRERLVREGLLEYENGFLTLTNKGQNRLDVLEMKDWKVDKPRKWDNRWRMLIFDIPEPRKALRNKVRMTLSSIGFLRLQDSVWIYPYDCEDLVSLLKADFKVGKDLLYIIVDSIENDKSFRKSFKL